MMRLTWAVLAGVVLSASVGAQPAAKPSGSEAVRDPNERICEDVILTGSRIGAKRFCATRAEWEDKKRQDREAIEKAQMGPCMITTTGGTGRPSC